MHECIEIIHFATQNFHGLSTEYFWNVLYSFPDYWSNCTRTVLLVLSNFWTYLKVEHSVMLISQYLFFPCITTTSIIMCNIIYAVTLQEKNYLSKIISYHCHHCHCHPIYPMFWGFDWFRILEIFNCAFVWTLRGIRVSGDTGSGLRYILCGINLWNFQTFFFQEY